MLTATRAYVSGDYLMELYGEAAWVECFDLGDSWNGWATPVFPAASVDRLIAMEKDMPCFKWAEREGELVVLYQDIGDDEPYVAYPLVVLVDGKPERAWPIGTWGWCWEHDYRPYSQRKEVAALLARQG